MDDIFLMMDASEDLLVMGLARCNDILSQRIVYHQQKLSRAIFVHLEELFSDANITPSSLSGIALGIGPGSYTSMRIGAMTAQTLAYALEIPQIPFCSPLAYIPDVEGTFIYLYPIRGGTWHLFRGQVLSHQLMYISHEKISFSVEEACCLYQGNHCILPANIQKKFSHLNAVAAVPNISLLASYIWDQLSRKDCFSPLIPVSLIYA